jgi:hypothetical protein
LTTRAAFTTTSCKAIESFDTFWISWARISAQEINAHSITIAVNNLLFFIVIIYFSKTCFLLQRYQKEKTEAKNMADMSLTFIN